MRLLHNLFSSLLPCSMLPPRSAEDNKEAACIFYTLAFSRIYSFSFYN